MVAFVVGRGGLTSSVAFVVGSSVVAASVVGRGVVIGSVAFFVGD